MELVYTCRGCNKYRVLDSETKTREELTKEAESQEFEVSCPFCNTPQKIHANFVVAVKTTFEKWAPLIYWLISLVIILIFLPRSTSLIWVTLSFLIPIFVYNRLNSAIRLFNSHRVK